MKLPRKLYEYHVKNLRSIETAIEQVARTIRKAISTNNEKIIFSYNRLFAFLIGAWAECRLQKLLYEPNSFNDNDRQKIYAKSQQINKWKYTVKIAFRKRYQVPRAALSEDTLHHSEFSRYITIMDMLEKDLRSIIEVRNKLAHGQWIYPLNSDNNDIAQKQMNTLKSENLLSLQFKKQLITHLADIIHDLIVSKPAFERDFNNHYKYIINTRRNLRTRNYEKYLWQMESKFERGKIKRQNSLKN